MWLWCNFPFRPVVSAQVSAGSRPLPGRPHRPPGPSRVHPAPRSRFLRGAVGSPGICISPSNLPLAARRVGEPCALPARTSLPPRRGESRARGRGGRRTRRRGGKERGRRTLAPAAGGTDQALRSTSTSPFAGAEIPAPLARPGFSWERAGWRGWGPAISAPGAGRGTRRPIPARRPSPLQLRYVDGTGSLSLRRLGKVCPRAGSRAPGPRVSGLGAQGRGG